MRTLLPILLLAGCATTPPPTIGFEHPTANQAQFMQDRFGCIQAARKPVSASAYNRAGAYASGVGYGDVVVSGSMYRACMGSMGYQPALTGRLQPTPGTTVVMTD